MEKKEKERQRKQNAERIDYRKKQNYSGNQRQRGWTKQRERTTAERKDRQNGRSTERIDYRRKKNYSGNQRQRRWTKHRENERHRVEFVSRNQREEKRQRKPKTDRM